MFSRLIDFAFFSFINFCIISTLIWVVVVAVAFIAWTPPEPVGMLAYRAAGIIALILGAAMTISEES